MSYQKLDFIPKSAKAYGRLYQMVGGKQVKKFAFSPFTAKPRKKYTFYADIELEAAIEYEGKEPIQTVTMQVQFGTFLVFRDAVISGEVNEKISAVVGLKGGLVKSVSFWRNIGEWKSQDVEGTP